MLDAIICPEWQYRCYPFNSEVTLEELRADIEELRADIEELAYGV